jgi:hypothetical protein
MAITADIAHRIPAGWYPCREDRSRRRWWDGTEWTEYFSDAPTRPIAIIDPIRHAIEASPVVETTIEREARAHTLRAALTFRDRIAAVVIFGVLVADLVVLAFLLRLI